MIEHFGFGEYERIDVKVRTSIWFFRHYFLNTLVSRKIDWANSLLRIANFDKLPSIFLEPRNLDTTFGFIFPCLLRKKPYNFDIKLEILDTPIYQYFSYFFHKEDEIEKLIDNNDSKNYYNPEFEKRKDAIKTILKDWNSIKSNPNARALKKTLEDWAKNYNLNEDWCLDFAVMILSNLKSYLDQVFKDFELHPLTTEKINKYISFFEYGCRESLREALSDFYLHNVTENLLDLDKRLKLDPFIFKHDYFESLPQTWFVRINRRKEFVEETFDFYNHRVEKIKLIDRFKKIDTEKYRIDLNRYCDAIENLISENFDEASLPSFPEKYDETIIYFSVWKPSQQKRENFINNFIIELRREFGKLKRMARSLETVGKDDFELALWNHCEKVEKSMPKYYVKTPTKYNSQIHFNWLIDFQVTPFKEYKEISESIDIGNRPTVDAVKKAIGRLAGDINISLRKPSRRGRPKGIIEIHKRHRVKK